MAAFEEARKAEFVDKTAAHLRKQFAEQTGSMSDKELKTFVEDSVRKAADYQLISERDVTRFTELHALMGKDFENRPEHKHVNAQLNNPNVSNPGRRLDNAFDTYLQRKT